MKPATQKLVLEDLSVGQVFKNPQRQINADEIKRFAKEYDPQPFHMDEDAAKGTFFGELVASGWQVAAITMRLLIECTPIEGGLVGAGGDIQWLRPTRPGDVLEVDSEVMAIKLSKRGDRGTVTMKSVAKNQDGKIVMVMTSRIVVPTRDGIRKALDELDA